MIDQQYNSERERLESLRGEVAENIEAAEKVFGAQSLLQPALEWFEELTNQIVEHEDLLRSEIGDESLKEEEVEELVFWAEGFSDSVNEGDDMEDECIPEELPESVAAALQHLIAHHLEPVRKASWALYHASIRAA